MKLQITATKKNSSWVMKQVGIIDTEDFKKPFQCSINNIIIRIKEVDKQ